MGTFDKYQTKVGRAQGGDTFFIKDGGNIDMEDGGTIDVADGATIDIADGGIMSFYSEDFTGEQLKNALLSEATVTNYTSTAALSTNLNVSIISPAYGYCVFSIAAGISTASIKLPSATKGAILYLYLSQIVSNALISVLASTGGGVAGVSLVNLAGAALSSLKITGSAAISHAKLAAIADGVWAVVVPSANVVENTA